MITRIIPSSREALPVIGIGTWQSFDVPKSDYDQRQSVLTTIYESGGRLIDSSS